MSALAAFAICAPALAKKWGTRFLDLATDEPKGIAAPTSIRVACIRAWRLIGPQSAGDEIRVANLLRVGSKEIGSGGQASKDGIRGAGSIVALEAQYAPLAVRMAALSVLVRLKYDPTPGV